MTLQEWSNRSGIDPVKPLLPNGVNTTAVSVTVEYNDKNRQTLWSLEDYLVSSVCGLTIWLRPRKPAVASFTVV